MKKTKTAYEIEETRKFKFKFDMIAFLVFFSLYMASPAFTVDAQLYIYGFHLSGFWGFLTFFLLFCVWYFAAA